jgi:hypothetical protein
MREKSRADDQTTARPGEIDLREGRRDQKGEAAARESQHPGSQADKPTEIPASGWKQVLKRAWAEAKADQVPLMAAGVAFFAFLSLFPMLIAAVLV